MAPSDADRKRAVDLIYRYRDEGKLSSNEAEEHVEQVFRARSISNLDGALGRLPSAPHIAADFVRSHGIPVSRATERQRPWWHGAVMYAVVGAAITLVFFVATGGSFVWVWIGFILTAIVLVFRLASHRKAALTGTKRRSVLRLR